LRHAPLDSLDRKVEPPVGRMLFKKWEHSCETEKLGDGTLVRDRVLYKLQLGILLDATAARSVSREIEFSLKQVRQGAAR
jgi:ligand-binding SRPBCC domain-containing protein